MKVSIKKANEELTVNSTSKDDTLSIQTGKEVLIITINDLAKLLDKDAKSNGSTALYNLEPTDKDKPF
jgi:hypothetical protein